MNQFEPTLFIKYAREFIMRKNVHIPEQELSAHIDVALAKIIQDIKATVFFYKGPLTLKGELYTANIVPNNGEKRDLKNETQKHAYRVYLVAKKTKQIFGYILHLSRDEVANFSEIAADRIAAKIGTPINKHLASKWTMQNPAHYEGGFRWAMAAELVENYLRYISVSADEEVVLTPGLVKELTKMLRNDVFDKRREMHSSFRRMLDVRVVEFMSANWDHNLNVYNALVRSGRSENVWLYRRNAAAVTRRSGLSHYWPVKSKVGFWTIISEGGTPVQAVSQSFGLPMHVARSALLPNDHENSMGAVAHTFLSGHDGGVVLRRLFIYQPNLHVPRSPSEWKMFKEVAELGLHFSGRNYYANADDAERIAGHMHELWKGCRGVKRWDDVAIQLMAGTPVAVIDGLTSYIDDMVASEFNKIVLPVILRSNLEYPSVYVIREIRARIGATYNYQQVIAAAKYWHENLPLFTHTLAGDNGRAKHKNWPTLIDTVDASDVPGGIVITPLKSEGDLDAEYQAFGHCIRSYAWRCLEGSTYLFGLSDQNGKKLSTLELVEVASEAGFKVRINQNRSVLNASAPEAARLAANWLVAQINDNPHFKTNIEALRIYQQQRKAQSAKDARDELHRRVGFDFKNLEVCEAVRRHFTPCFPKWMREQIGSVDDYLRVKGIDKILQKYGYLSVANQDDPQRPSSREPANDGGHIIG